MLSLACLVPVVKSLCICVSAAPQGGISEFQHDVDQDAFARFVFFFFNLWYLG